LVDGVTLSDWRKEEKPDQKQSAMMVSKIARAIHKAHLKGVVHRDLKPRNIIVDYEGQPHVTDFGLAKRENPEQITITTKGQVIGTPAYMSPEQASGQAAHVDGRADVYSLGVILYELLSGVRPFRGETDLLIYEVIAGGAAPPSRHRRGISADLEAICLKAMSVRPGNRFASALELAEDLDRFIGGQPTFTRPLSKIQKAVRFAKSRWLPISVACLVLGVFGLVVYAFLNSMFAADKVYRLAVAFDTEPPGSEVTIIPFNDYVDPYSAAEVIEPGKSKDGSFAVDLEPGWYFVRAIVPGHGTQESIRIVPSFVDDRSTINLHPKAAVLKTHWDAAPDGGVRWQTIEIKKATPTGDGAISLQGEPLHLVRGGKILSGCDPVNELGALAFLPKSKVDVPDFFVAPTEVTVKRFQNFMGYVPSGMSKQYNNIVPDEYPVTHVSLLECLDYCERIGARLITYNEYVYLATNRGTTEFPWGNAQQDWEKLQQPGPVGSPAFDATQSEPIVFNLYSSVAERTAQAFLPIDPKSNRKDGWVAPMLAAIQNARIVVGQPTKSASRNNLISPRNFTTIDFDRQDKHIGFRCARSAEYPSN
jgi:hypothetical protein